MLPSIPLLKDTATHQIRKKRIISYIAPQEIDLQCYSYDP